MTAPELRFPEFSAPWREGHAGDAFTNSKAKGEAGLPIWSVTLDRGLVPRDSLDRHMESDAADETNLRAQPGDLVYNMMRMWQGAVGQATEECMVSPAYVVLHPKKGTSSTFFDYWFNAPHMLHKLGAYSHGLTKDRLRLYYADFAKIPLAIPEPAEQAKIAEFLDAVSEKLEMLVQEHEKMVVFKQGAMQQLFSRAIRFTRDDGNAFPEWTKQRLGDVFTRVRRKNADWNDRVLTISGQDGLVDQTAYFGRSVAGKDLSGYYLLKKGEFAYNKSYSNGYPMGAIKRLNRYEDGAVSTLYICFATDDEVSARFFEQYFESGELNHGLYRIAQEGARNHGLLNIAVADFFEQLTVPVPHPDEQRKIADALAAIDAKIDAVGTQITQMETFKRGLLQKMFV